MIFNCFFLVFEPSVERSTWYAVKMLGWKRYDYCSRNVFIPYFKLNVVNAIINHMFFTQFQPLKGYYGKSWIEKVEWLME